MTQTLRNIGIIGRITMLEGARKQVFHVLLLVAVFLIFGSAILSRFDRHVQMKMFSDLAMVSMTFIGSIIAITIAVTGVPGEVEQKTIYPIIAKPVQRWEFIVGKYAGAMGTVAIAFAVMTATFSFLQIFYMGHVEPAIFFVVPYLFLQTAITGAIALWFSTFTSWPLAWFLSVVACLLGNLKFSLFDSLMTRDTLPFNRFTIQMLFNMLPSMESFNFKDAMVHHLFVPTPYLIQTAVYGVAFTTMLLIMASLTFAKKEL